MGGKHNKAGFYNAGPNLANLDNNKDLKFELDFRRVYASILDEWLQVPSAEILGREFNGLGLV